MKTPITDLNAEPASYYQGTIIGVVPEAIARRLEADRAALMDALEKFEGCFDCYECTGTAETALAAARANFPKP